MYPEQGTLARGRSTGHIQKEAGTGERERRASGATTLEDREEPVMNLPLGRRPRIPAPSKDVRSRQGIYYKEE